jgi:hypothetical protein
MMAQAPARDGQHESVANGRNEIHARARQRKVAAVLGEGGEKVGDVERRDLSDQGLRGTPVAL